MTDAARVTFVGHSTTVIEIGRTVVVTDPVLRGRVWFLRSTAARSVPPAHVVLVSHLHHDHCDRRSLARAGKQCAAVVPAGTTSLFRRLGFADIVGLRPGESRQIRDVIITATPAVHDGRRWPVGAKRTALGFVISGNGVSVYFAGDTDIFDGMGELDEPDIALIPVWGWGRSLGPGHLDPARAADAVALLRARVAVPIHWGTLRPSWERRRASEVAAPARQFLDEVRRRGLATQVVLLQPGESLAWPASVGAFSR